MYVFLCGARLAVVGLGDGPARQVCVANVDDQLLQVATQGVDCMTVAVTVSTCTATRLHQHPRHGHRHLPVPSRTLQKEGRRWQRIQGLRTTPVSRRRKSPPPELMQTTDTNPFVRVWKEKWDRTAQARAPDMHLGATQGVIALHCGCIVIVLFVIG